MEPKDTPFTDLYVADQERNMSRALKLFAITGMVIGAAGILIGFSSTHYEAQSSLIMALLFLMWAAMLNQRRNTFRENVELSKMIQQQGGRTEQ